jgi:hypothetical protein
LQICSELLVSISNNKDHEHNLKKLTGNSNKDSIVDLVKHFKEFENLNYKERIQLCLLPLVSFLSETSQDERKLLLNAIYNRKTKKTIPEPIIP